MSMYDGGCRRCDGEVLRQENVAPGRHAHVHVRDSLPSAPPDLRLPGKRWTTRLSARSWASASASAHLGHVWCVSCIHTGCASGRASARRVTYPCLGDDAGSNMHMQDAPGVPRSPCPHLPFTCLEFYHHIPEQQDIIF